MLPKYNHVAAIYIIARGGKDFVRVGDGGCNVLVDNTVTHKVVKFKGIQGEGGRCCPSLNETVMCCVVFGVSTLLCEHLHCAYISGLFRRIEVYLWNEGVGLICANVIASV